MKYFFGCIFLLFSGITLAQDAVTYQTPPKAIADLVLAKPTPTISVDNQGEWMLLMQRNSYPSVEELGQPEIRVAGMRMNPNNFSASRQTFINTLSLKDIKTGKTFSISGLPENLMASAVSWSPSEKKIGFTNQTATRVDLYVIDVASKQAKRINKNPLNVLMGAAFTWLDDETLLYKTVLKPVSRAPKKPITPGGPTIQESYGKAAPRPTYQDMIKSPYDEQLFEFYTTVQVVKNSKSIETPMGKPAIYTQLSPSPDKKYLLVRTIEKPYSYTVPAGGFKSSLNIWDSNGKMVKEIAQLPSSETAPAGNDNVQDVARSHAWRDDEAATITWVKALDGGLIKNQATHRDAVYALAAPFTGEAKEIAKTTMRYGGIMWGDAQFALLTEVLRGKQQLRTHRLNPATGETELLFERSLTNAYANPGSPIMRKNEFGRNVIERLNNGTTLLMNNTTGASPRGDLPYLSSFNLTTKKTDTLWRCREGYFETITEVLDSKNLILLTRRESNTEVPNYYIRNLKLKVADQQITDFPNPYPALEGVTKQKIKYKRADGVDLTGDLYLPKGYDAKTMGPLPVLLWAYPREFNNAADAAQVRGSSHTFTRISWGSPIYYVTQGYAVLDNAEMPIVSTSPDKKPNDNFIAQLKLNARAAIDQLASMGVGDSTRVGVGGHSYGAFMTANLLAHTNWFKAGIARSGAYNRTLTPFSFQNEDRTYWQVPQLYYDMSPFSFAHQLKTPILLIHGDTDDNTGTYPIQSERMFAALKGNGAKVRYVSLPYEAHGYRGMENVLHTLWEQYQWLEKYVKLKK